MSEDTPESTPELTPELTQPLPGPDEEPQLLVPEPVPPTRKPRRGRIAAAVALVLALALGGGAWAVWSWLNGGGPQPDDALPASTVALVSLDLDPSAGQKIAAFKTLRKFPALKKNLGLNSRDDLRKYIVDEIVDSSGCDLDYDDDVKPWIGNRVGIAAVDLGNDEPAPAIAIAVGDQAKATRGFKALAKCADMGSDIGFVVGEDYLVASDTPEHAKQIVADAKKDPLSDDPTYKKWTGKVGDRGVLSFYVSKRALPLLAKVVANELQGQVAEASAVSYDERPFDSGIARKGTSTEDCGNLAGELEMEVGKSKFEGFAGTLRFSGGGMELSAVAGSGAPTSTATLGEKLTGLPEDTSAALAMAPGKDFAAQWEKGFDLGSCGSSDDLLSGLEDETGLKLPQDLTTLLGGGLSLSVGKVPADPDDIEDPSDIPVGLLVHGDSAAINEIIHRVEARVGGSLSDVGIGSKSADGKVVVSTSEAYADELLKTGSLGQQSRFRDVVPEADKASFAFYLDFDSSLRDTVKKAIAEDSGRADARTWEENTEPLEALGVSTWTDGSGTHFLLKIGTD